PGFRRSRLRQRRNHGRQRRRVFRLTWSRYWDHAALPPYGEPLYKTILPHAIADLDDRTPYWPGSPLAATITIAGTKATSTTGTSGIATSHAVSATDYVAKTRRRPSATGAMPKTPDASSVNL